MKNATMRRLTEVDFALFIQVLTSILAAFYRHRYNYISRKLEFTYLTCHHGFFRWFTKYMTNR